MRSLSLHCRTIQIASVAGESRRISVSGLAKARLLWLFRNFSILEFPVLSKGEQQLIYQMWNSGIRTPSKQAPRDVIGTIEAFSPQRCAEQTSAPKTSSARPASTKESSAQLFSGKPAFGKESSGPLSSEKVRSDQPCSEKPDQPRARFTLRARVRSAATWRACTVLLLGAAMYLGARYLPPKHPQKPQTQVAAAADEKQHTHSTTAEAAAHIAAVPVAATVAAPVVAPESFAEPSPASSAVRPNPAPELPEAMAHQATSTQVELPNHARKPTEGFHPSTPTAGALETPGLPAAPHRNVAGPREVLIRVSVDAAGQAQDFQVLGSDQEKTSAALKAARLWKFKPCSGGEACEQVLKFTDYGDSSRVQRIE